MISLPLGFAFALGVFVFALAGSKLDSIINSHSMVLVVGGTFAVLFLSTPWKELWNMCRAVWKLARPGAADNRINSVLLDLARNRAAAVTDCHPLVSYAQELWEQGLDRKMFTLLLNQKLEELDATTERSVIALRNLAKYPPALGMTGTVIGLVAMFSGLTPDNRQHLGPSLAMAMTATLYGLLMANAILLPLSDRLHVMHMSRVKANDRIFQALMLINNGEPRSIIEEGLNADAA
jgi:chemotaxis protein MotA